MLPRVLELIWEGLTLVTLSGSLGFMVALEAWPGTGMVGKKVVPGRSGPDPVWKPGPGGPSS